MNCSKDCAIITTEQQMEINRHFLKMGGITRQREFVVKHFAIVEPKYTGCARERNSFMRFGNFL